MKMIKVMGSETSPAAIALAAVLGLALACNPLLSVQAVCCILLVIFTKVNIAACLFSVLIFSCVSFLFSGMLESIGLSLLENESLLGLWTYLYNSSLFSLTQFYNSAVLGGMLACLVLIIPVFVGTLAFVKYYRHSIEPKIRNSPLAKAIKASKLYKMYILMTSPIGGAGS